MTELWQNVLTAVIFAALGIALFIIAFWLWDRATPYSLWKEIIEEKNTALAIVVGAMSIGLCLIIAVAIS